MVEVRREMKPLLESPDDKTESKKEEHKKKLLEYKKVLLEFPDNKTESKKEERKKKLLE